MKLTPPQPLLTWTHTPEEIVKLTKDAIDANRVSLDKVGSLDPKDCTFESVFRALAVAETQLEATAEPLGFYRDVSPVKEIRDASTEAESLVGDYRVELSMRLDVFNAKVNAEQNTKTSGQWNDLSSEEKRLTEKMILDGKRAGLALHREKRDELTKLKKELSQVCLQFGQNLNEENGSITFTAEQLTGVPDDDMSSFTRITEGDKEVFTVSYKSPGIFSVFGGAEDPQTRQRAWEGFQSRLSVNVPLLDRVVKLRHQIASLLGYESWADYVTEVKMVKTGKNAWDFLDDLHRKLLPFGIKEKEFLLEMKRQEHEAKGYPVDNEFYSWDDSYYGKKYLKKTLELDPLVLKEYFPVSVVVPAILSIYQNLLGVRFEELKDASTWHTEVQPFAVWEKDAQDDTGFVGYCYLDLFARAGKHSNAAMWTLLTGYETTDGRTHYPVTAMVASQPKPTTEKPALMGHDDVVTLFHEMGHVFHGLLSRAQFGRFHGTSVALDFGEAPSQMLENWCWEPNVLEKLSGHYQTQQSLPSEMIQKLIKSRYLNVGLHYLKQIFYSKYDLKIHIDEGIKDSTKLWNTLREQVGLLKNDKDLPEQGALGHLVNGYDVGLYGYAYSLVFAADMYVYSKQIHSTPLVENSTAIKFSIHYGSSRDEMDSLKDFLGREPNSEAFTKLLFGAA